MTLKSDAKFKEKLTCDFKCDMRNLVNFYPTTQKSRKCYFNGLFLSKVFEIWAKTTLGSHLSWHWTVMQNLNKPWTLWSQKWHEELGKLSWGWGWVERGSVVFSSGWEINICSTVFRDLGKNMVGKRYFQH